MAQKIKKPRKEFLLLLVASIFIIAFLSFSNSYNTGNNANPSNFGHTTNEIAGLDAALASVGAGIPTEGGLIAGNFTQWITSNNETGNGVCSHLNSGTQTFSCRTVYRTVTITYDNGGVSTTADILQKTGCNTTIPKNDWASNGSAFAVCTSN